MHYIGIGFALVALVAWGFGDFFIQRTSRAYGIWTSTFCVTGAGALVLLPFVWNRLPSLFGHEYLGYLIILGAGTLLVGLVTFAALREGKIAVIEPIMSFELPLTILLVVLLLREEMTSLQGLLIAFVFGGILLVGYTGRVATQTLLERGVLLALLAAVLQAFVNFGTGLSARTLGPVETIWFVHTFIAFICVLYFTATFSWKVVLKDFRAHPKESISLAILDNAAWVAYSYATIFIPISLAITISEMYIILTIILGVSISKEKLLVHQWIGVVVAVISVLVLSAFS